MRLVSLFPTWVNHIGIADEDSDANDMLNSRPLYERSSPVEEWSSDSRDSTHLEISRYDNVSPSGTLTRRIVSLPSN